MHDEHGLPHGSPEYSRRLICADRASQYKRWSLRSGRVMASCRVAAGIVPADSDQRMPRVRGPSWLVFGGKGLFPPKPPFISSLFRRGGPCPQAGGVGLPGLPAPHSLVWGMRGGRGYTPATVKRYRVPPPSSPATTARPVRHPALAGSAVARPPAGNRASVAVRSGSHPGKPARTASFFHSFIIAY